MNKHFEQSIVWWIVLIATCAALWLNDHPQVVEDLIEWLKPL